MSQPRLYLVDGMSHVYRAYYAIRGLTDREGRSTNAVYGFTVMLRKLIADEEPEFLGVAIDLLGPTVRHEQYEDYKATRPKMPADLAEQLPFVYQVCEAMRIPVISYEGYEADDVIGTLARQAAGEGIETVVVSIDKDLLQLVDDQVSVLDTRTMRRFTPTEVEEKWGVPPERIVDVLSLVGDSSDNIPGAPGIGEKGAKKLIREYGSLEELLQHRDEVKRKSYRESLQENEEQILQSRSLLRIVRDLPVDLDLDRLALAEPDFDKLAEVYEELDFQKLLEELPLQRESFEPDLTVIRDSSDLSSLTEQIAGREVAAAWWFAGEDPTQGELDGVAIQTDQKKTYYMSGETVHGNWELFSSMVRSPSRWFMHDLKSWMTFAQCHGWVWDPNDSQDTMLMAYLLDPNQRDFSLDKVVAERLGRSLESSVEGELLPDSRPEDLAARALATRLLADRLRIEVSEQGLDRVLWEIEQPLVEVLASMEKIGVRIDVDLLEEMSCELGEELDDLTEQVYERAGQEFNLNSPKQLSEVLFEQMQLPTSKKKGKAGHYSTGVEILEKLAPQYEIAQLILDYRELAKLKSTYLDALPRLIHPRTGRIHTSYNQMVASTGRLSSSNPNLQNIPIRSDQGRRIRKAFVPEDGFLILAADYSQIELRVMAHLSQDPVLLEAFQQGEDIHERTAREVFGSDPEADRAELRRHAKVINFGIMYGLSAYGLGQSLKIDRKQAQKFIDGYFERYRGVKEWTERTLEEAESEGFVRTLFGRLRPIPEIASKNWNLREFARRTAINAPIQGTAADLIKLAMVRLFRRMRELELRSRLILQVHDELVLEVFREELDQVTQLVRTEMEEVTELRVPLEVDLAVGSSWYEAK